MKIHLSRRRTIAAAAAATLALGSAAAYAAIGLPELPVKLPGINLDLPIDLPNPLISPPDTQLPANPIVGPPDGDELSDITKILDPSDPDPNAGPPKQGPSPAARRPVPGPQAAKAPHDASGDAAAAARDLEELKKLNDPEALAELLSHRDWSDEDWAKWAKDHADGSISVTIGRGINVCNNNNVKVIVNRDSTDDENTIEQHSSSGTVVTNVDGHDTDSADPGISCEH